MLKFKKEITGVQSPWIIGVYEQYFSNKTDGFLVEIGVGGTINWQAMGHRWPYMLDWDKEWDDGKIIRGGNHTLELVEQGWKGIYIESLHELIDNELKPLLDKILPEEYKDNVTIIKSGASDKKRICKISHHENLEECPSDVEDIDEIIPYEYHLHGGRKLYCEKTSTLLEDNNCPKDIDLMVIDVEGHELHVLKGIDFDKHLPKMMFIETDKISVNSIMDIIPDDYIVLCSDGLNTMFILEDFYKGPFVGKVNH